MKKFILAGLVAILMVGAVGAAVVYAQGPDDGPETPWGGACGEDCSSWIGRMMDNRGGSREFANPLGRMGDTDQDGRGLMEDYLVAFAADKLGLSADDIEARLEAGETLAEIAESEGVDYDAFMAEARDYAREQMADDGIEMPGWGMWNSDTDGRNFPSRGEYDPELCGPGRSLQDDGTALRQSGRGRRNR